MSATTSPTKIVFPPPPPTTNSLTAQQRVQLMRKAKKLEQILGAAPHLLDVHNDASSPVHIALPKLDKRPTSPSTIRTSTESFASSFSSSASSASSLATSSAPSSRGSVGRSSSTLRKARPPLGDSSPRSPSYETWSSTKPPFLRLSLAHSEPLTTSCLPPHIAAALPKTDKSSQHSRFTMAPPVPRTASSALVPSNPPDFCVNSMGSTRKSKMDRLRKKLGQGVPIELVFPTDSENESAEESPISPTAERISAFVFPSPRVPRTKAKIGTIAGARDSLTEESIHHAPRAPALPKSTGLRSQVGKEALGSIIESPDEHGTGCAEEFGMRRSSGGGNVPKRYDEAGEAEIKVWSTREGYEGWEPIVISKGRRPWGYRKQIQATEM